MFSIKSTDQNGKKFIELQNKEKSTIAKISLNEGARITDLAFQSIHVIEELADFDYGDSYASSFLFPFVSRVENGKYRFLGEDYQLERKSNNTSALHGLVYNKTFKVVEVEEQKTYCSATLSYFENKLNEGFPFQYHFSVNYTLSENQLQIKITAKNNDSKPFPFTLGWHPYFSSSNLNESFVTFNSNKKAVFNDDLIAKDFIEVNQKGVFALKNKSLDDCFFLTDNQVDFSTPEYQVKINSDKTENYLQMYTPPNKNIIAIEPMTGISNSFNNKVGLQVLQPNETYAICWKLDFQKN